MSKRPPLKLYDQAEVDRAKAKHGAEILAEERRRIVAWVQRTGLSRSPDGNMVLDWLEHDEWPKEPKP